MRGKLSEPALRDLAVEVAEEVESQAPADWLWKERHAKLVDGFTFTMPDTPARQAAFPQHRAQKPGVGFPNARACALISLATATILNLKIGPYAGKESGESASDQLHLYLPAGVGLVDAVCRQCGPIRKASGTLPPTAACNRSMQSGKSSR
ncbi:MAG: hypothetical protein KJZ78_15360, partial [Bryobacteraceae bacterium]|nr:hypothetical protein [Bryobacteraceae bacterium]